MNKDQSTGKDPVSTSNQVIEDTAKDEKEIKAWVKFFKWKKYKQGQKCNPKSLSNCSMR